MPNPIKIAIHKLTEKFIHIENIDPNNKELRRNCYCLKCDEKLQAVLEFQDTDRIKFFRHDTNPNCEGSQETALHELAKQILLDNLYITTKEYGKISFSNAVAEKRLEQKRPDITATYDNREIYLEVYVSHAVDSGKKKFFIDKKNRSLEINLSNCATSDVTEIKRLVLDEVSNKEIFYWQDEKQIEEITAKDGVTKFINFVCKYWKEILGVFVSFIALRFIFWRKK
jgi:hypothetical protein